MNSAIQRGSLPQRPLTPLFATHMSRSQIAEYTTALSPLLATHTDFSPVSPVFATHTKTTGVYTNNSHSGTEHPRRMRVLSESPAADESKDLSRRPPLTALLSSRDEKFVTATPLDSAFTNRDARNPFRMCIYENCRVSHGSRQAFLRFYLNSVPSASLRPSALMFCRSDHRPPLTTVNGPLTTLLQQ